MILTELKKIGPEKLSPLRVEQLITNYEKAVDALRFYGDGYLFDEEDEDSEQLDINKPWRWYSGKLARQTLKELGEI